MPDWISSILGIGSAGLKLLLGVFQSKNTADMVADKKASNTQASNDKINDDVAAGDVDEIRKDTET